MVKAAYFDENGMKKGAWSAEEDEKLRAYVLTYGHWNWRALPKFAGLSRCGKSCRLRWMNYLRPNLKRGKYTKEEEDLIIQLHQNLGNKWSAIAAKLPGRTDNEIKNHWHTHLKKRVEQNHSVASKRREQSVGMTLTHERSDRETNQKGEFASQDVAESAHPPILESYALSPEPSSLSKISDHVPSIANNWEPQDGLMANCFWSEPFLVDKSYGQSDFSTALGEGEFPSLFGSNFDDDSDFFHELLR